MVLSSIFNTIVMSWTADFWFYYTAPIRGSVTPEQLEFTCWSLWFQCVFLQAYFPGFKFLSRTKVIFVIGLHESYLLMVLPKSGTQNSASRRWILKLGGSSMSIISHKHLLLTIYWQCDHGIVLYLEPAAGTEMTKSWRHGLRISTFTPCPIVSRVNSRIAS
jgi:hypothetical protein